MSTDADKVRAAADYIERVGLHKGSAVDHAAAAAKGLSYVDSSAVEAVQHDVPCCTLGALWGHDFDTWVEDPDGGHDALGLFLGDVVARWNDAPERTKDEVVTTLRAFADTLDAQPE